MSIQSEAALEAGLIATLQQMDYEYVQIAEEDNLQANFKRQLEIHNGWLNMVELNLRQRNLKRFLSILKAVHDLKRRRNYATFIRLIRQTVNVFGWNFSIVNNGVRTSFRFPIK